MKLLCAAERTVVYEKAMGSGFARMASLVALVAIAVFAPTLGYGFTYLDDDQLILSRGSFLSDASNLFRAFLEPYFGRGSSSYYRPLVTASYVLDAQWTGLSALGYHATNVALHGGISVLVLWLLLELGVGELPARIGAMGFAAHPAQTASVAWIVGRNDLLMTGFVLLGVACLFADQRRPRPLTKFCHVACFALALLSKETAVLGPLVFAGFAWAADRRVVLKQRWLWAAWAATLALYLFVRSLVLTDLGAGSAGLAGLSLQHAKIPLVDLGKLFAPVHLQVLSAPEDLELWPGLVAAVLIAAALIGVRGLRPPVLALVATLLFLPGLAGLYGAKFVVLENRLYLAVVGVALLGSEVLRALESSGRQRALLSVAPAALLIALATLSVRYSPSFKDGYHFSRAAIAASPNSGLAVNLVQRAAMRNRPADAAESSQ